jgi:hypothetical protein
MADHVVNVRSQEMMVAAAADVLFDWPNNFFQLLRSFAKSRKLKNGNFLAQFDGLYRRLCHSRDKHAQFFKRAFAEFGRDHWEYGVIDTRLLNSVGLKQTKRAYSPADAARHFGVMPLTANKLLRKTRVPSRLVRIGKRKRRIYDITDLDLREYDRSRLIRMRDAAKRIGIPVALLRALKNNGYYVSRLPIQGGFDVVEVDEFRIRLLSLNNNTGQAVIANCITLGRITHTDAAFEAIVAIFANELQVVGNADGTVGGLLIPRADFVKLRAEMRAKKFGNARTPTEVSKMIGCSPEAVPGLVSIGLLRGKRVPMGLRIFEESIAEFNRNFVCLAVLAKQLNRIYRWFARDCERQQISLIRVPRSLQFIVQIRDVKKILRQYSTNSTPAVAA